MKLLRVFGLLFLFSFGTTLLLTQFTISGGKELQHIRIDIPMGETVDEIADALRDHGLIHSAMAFRLYLKSRELDTDVKSGTFVFEKGLSFAEIADMLVSGEGKNAVVTIPEGYTVSQIDALLTDMDLTEEGAVLSCMRDCDLSSFAFLPSAHPRSPGGALEGYLFPDTYFVNPIGFSAELFLSRLLSTFDKRVIEGLQEDIAASDRSLEEIVIMASLIERETRTDAERPVVSGILWKRFDATRGLDVDASIRYGLSKFTEPLTRENLEDRTNPYNSRRHVGLPPGAIANAGIASIKAALHPQESDYWYYLHGNDGQIRYAESNDDHNVNKAKYL
jgi:UPF0755 protein